MKRSQEGKRSGADNDAIDRANANQQDGRYRQSGRIRIRAGGAAPASVTQDVGGTHLTVGIPKGDKGDKGRAGNTGQGIQGEQGYSAYEVWEQSNAGKTEAEYIAFLKQEALAAADIANASALAAQNNLLWRGNHKPAPCTSPCMSEQVVNQSKREQATLHPTIRPFYRGKR